MDNNKKSSLTQQELVANLEKIQKFAEDISNPVTDAATHPDGYLDAALLLCGLGYFLDKTIDVLARTR